MRRAPKGSIDTTERNTARGTIITPERLAASGTEHGEQTALMQWTVIDGRIYQDLDLLHAIPNGGDRTPSVAANLKAEGVKSGVPDLCLPVPIGQYAGLYIEMKRKTGYGKTRGDRSEKQVDWHKRLVKQRYCVVTCYGWIAAARAIQDYYLSLIDMATAEAEGDCVYYPPREDRSCLTSI